MLTYIVWLRFDSRLDPHGVWLILFRGHFATSRSRVAMANLISRGNSGGCNCGAKVSRVRLIGPAGVDRTATPKDHCVAPVLRLCVGDLVASDVFR